MAEIATDAWLSLTALPVPSIWAVEELLVGRPCSCGSCSAHCCCIASRPGAFASNVVDALKMLARDAGMLKETEEPEEGESKKDDLISWLPLALLLCSSAPSVVPGLVLCGLTIHSKVVFAAVAAACFAGGCSIYSRHPQMNRRFFQMQGAQVLFTTSAVHLAMVLLGGAPDEMIPFIHFPEMFMHYATDLITVPVILANLGFLAGFSTYSMLPLFGTAITSTLFNMASCVPPDLQERLIFFGLGLAFQATAAYQLTRFPKTIQHRGPDTERRCQLVCDLLVFTWTLYPAIQVCGLTGSLSMPFVLNDLALLDILSKLGTTHLTLRDSGILQTAIDVFEIQIDEQEHAARRDAQAPRPQDPAAPARPKSGRSDAEPFSEPPPGRM